MNERISPISPLQYQSLPDIAAEARRLRRDSFSMVDRILTGLVAINAILFFGMLMVRYAIPEASNYLAGSEDSFANGISLIGVAILSFLAVVVNLRYLYRAVFAAPSPTHSIVDRIVAVVFFAPTAIASICTCFLLYADYARPWPYDGHDYRPADVNAMVIFSISAFLCLGATFFAFKPRRKPPPEPQPQSS